MSTYYSQTRFISNSDLSALQRVLNLQDAALNCRAALDFGNLVDYRFTEPDKFEENEASDSDKEKAELMYHAGLADSSLKLYFEKSRMQHEFYRRAFPIQFEGWHIEIPARGKLDFTIKSLRSGADLKTTACTSQKSFVQSVFHLGYDRAAAWYMDLARLDSFMIIGIGKKKNRLTMKYPVFKYAIQRDDEVFESAQWKYSRLAFYYYFLIHGFKLN